MVEIDADTALLVVGVVVVLSAGWGSYVSVRSAAAGPEWALGHLAAVRSPIWGLLILGLLLAVVASPPWMGLGLVYVGAAIMFLVAMLRRSLLRLQEFGAFDELDPERRAAIVRRARTLFLVMGALFAILGGAALALEAGVIAWIVIALGVTLAAAAAFQTDAARGS